MNKWFKTSFQKLGFIVLSQLVLTSLGYAAPSSQTLTIKSIFPENITDTTNQVKVEFSEKMAKLGNGNDTADIFTVSCSPNIAGRGRWQSETLWTYEFSTSQPGNKLPGGTRCQVEAMPGLKSLAGHTLSGKSSFTFQVDGPNILDLSPSQKVTEDQVFILQLDSIVDLSSLKQNSYFVVDGKANKVAIDIIEGDAREKILKAAYYDEPNSKTIILIKARENFPNKAKVTLLWGPGIKSEESGLSRLQTTKYNFVVRSGFTVEFSCERENAKANCLPVTPMRLNFSTPVPMEYAKEIRLIGKDGTYKPVLSENENVVDSVKFKPPFAENAEYKVVLPSKFLDDAGRSAINKSKFPLIVKTTDLPPLAKFNSDFGVLEAKENVKGKVLLPVTLRDIEAQSQNKAVVTGKALRLESNQFGLAIQWLREVTSREDKDREISILKNEKQSAKVTSFEIPVQKNRKSFEVVGIPLPQSGFYVVELKSQNLGDSLLGKGKTMYVPTIALVTDLAVHIKWGRENSLFWVTSLSSGKPVPGANVAVHNCRGDKVWAGVSGTQGTLKYKGNIKTLTTLAEGQSCSDNPDSYSSYDGGFFVTAQLAKDFTFTHTGWTDGIETWRFGQGDNYLDTKSPSWNTEADLIAHSVIDRTLVRAGETVSMKHFLRKPVTTGLSLLKKDELPTKVLIEHQASDAKFEVPLNWDGKGSASTSDFKVPAEALLGQYSITLFNEKANKTYYTGSFQVEEFKVPLYKGSLVLPKDDLVKPASVEAQIAVNYLNGGPVANLKGILRYYLTSVEETKFPQYEGFVFSNGSVNVGVTRSGEDDESSEAIRINSQPVQLDATGTGHVQLTQLPIEQTPKMLNAELEYRDSNGESQTIGQSKLLWASAKQVGVKITRWLSSSDNVEVELAVTDLKGRPQANATTTLKAYKVNFYTHRTRLVGGYYSYESLKEVIEAAADVTCAAKTDTKGLNKCNVRLPSSGRYILVAETTDANGNKISAHGDAYVRGSEDMWFEMDNNDRIDLIAEKKSYEPGETAKLQVRMPFREATALVTVEREGILTSIVTHLSGKNPVLSVPVSNSYTPNVYVSVLLVRGRVEAGPKDTTALVDLAKPAYKMGLTELKVNWKAHGLVVNVNPEKATYAPREEATLKVKVARQLPNTARLGIPGGEVAIAVIDEGLLQIAPNHSWDLLKSMMSHRPLETETSTVQMQVIGKRHFGLKAVAHGGGGGSGQQLTREFFDTLVYWNPRVTLDEKGEAVVRFKMNDSLTQFRVVAIANADNALFGMGESSITTVQDLISTTSIPTLARTGDTFSPEFTFRNTTDTGLTLTLRGTVTFRMADGTTRTIPVPSTSVTLGGKDAKTLSVAKVDVPEGAIDATYDIEVVDQNGKSKDHIKVVQKVQSSIPVRAYMASLKQLISGQEEFEIQIPKGALANVGGVQVTLTPSLNSGLTTVSQYMKDYPYDSIESRFSKAIISYDAKQWQKVTAQLPAQLDKNGLVKFYPTAETGNELLTAYMLSASKICGLAIPESLSEKMLKGLEDYVAGRIRQPSSERQNTVALFSSRVYVMETLTLYGAINASQLTSLPQINTQQIGSATLVSWAALLENLDRDNFHASTKKEVLKAIEARLVINGNRYNYSQVRDSNWFIDSADANMARLVLLVMQNPNIGKIFGEKLPKMILGLISQNTKGAWDTTIANVFSSIALRVFASVYEKESITGITQVQLGELTKKADWATKKNGAILKFPWPEQGQGTVKIQHQGTGTPWSLVATQAAVELKQANFAGFTVDKSLKTIQQKVAGQWSVGDIVEIHLKVKANAATNQVAIIDPIPAGAKIIKSGLIESLNYVYPSLEQLSYEAYKAFYDWVPDTEIETVYQIQLNQAGKFKVPPTRVEAVYYPEMHGETPNSGIEVK